MDWTAFMFSLPLAAVRTAHLTFAITEICRPDDGRSRPVATAGLQVLRSSASRFKTKERGTKASDRIPRPATGEHLPANAAPRWRVHPVGAVTFRRKIGA